jgi:hypothetical protein
VCPPLRSPLWGFQKIRSGRGGIDPGAAARAVEAMADQNHEEEEEEEEESDEEESDEEEYQSRTRGPKPQRAEKDDAGQASQKKAFRFRPAKSTVPDAWHFWPVQESREEVKRKKNSNNIYFGN